MDIVNFKAWEGRIAEEAGSVSALAATQIGAALEGHRFSPLRAGDPLPALWHWCAFPSVLAQAELGADGHPKLGDFLPPVRLPRRMWAGGALSFHAPLRIGDPLTRLSTILKVEDKSTEQTPMVFVTLQHNIIGPRGLAVEEQQTLVYLDIPKSFVPPKKRPMPEPQARIDLAETALFRFSAVTFNAHRIHYDLAYTREVERYPGLVIHGPLQAMHLMALATRTRGTAPSLFDFRGVHPMFLGAPLDLAAEDTGEEGMRLFSGQAGHQGMQARALWEGTV